MNKNTRNLLLIAFCLSLICTWIWKRMASLPKQEGQYKERVEGYNDLIFDLMKNDYSIEYIINSCGGGSILYQDTANYLNVLKRLDPHKINIGQIAPINTKRFLSLSYSNEARKFLKNNEHIKFNTEEVEGNILYKNIDGYNLNINEIGQFSSGEDQFYYLRDTEGSSTSSILSLIRDSSINITINDTINNQKKRIYKVYEKNLFYLLAGKIFDEEKDYYIDIITTKGTYFIFHQDSNSLKYVYESFKSDSTLKSSPYYIDFLNNQFANYSLNYYTNISSQIEKYPDSISENTTLTYQLRGEENSILTYLNLLHTKRNDKKDVDIHTNEPTQDSSMNIIEGTEEEIIEEGVEEVIEEVGEITYTVVKGDSFREASLKFKLKLEENGYEYNKVKQGHVFFIIDSGNTKLNWNTAVNKYLDKKQPEEGDYFLMKRFFY